MTDNALKIIKDELARIDEDNEEKFNDRDSNGNGFEDYYIVDKDKEKLTKALSVAVEQLDAIVGKREYSISKEPHKFIADETLELIANILSGGKDWK